MASPKHIRIELNGEYYVKGLYLVDDGRFSAYEVIDNSLKTSIKPPFKLMLRAYVTVQGKYVERKKVFSFDKPVTFLNAVNHVRNSKNSFKHDAIENPTKTKHTANTIEKMREENERLNITLGSYWETDYCPYKTSTIRAKESWRDSTAKDMKSFYNAWIKQSKLHAMPVRSITTEDIEELIAKVKSQRSIRTAKKVTEALAPLFKRFYKANKINELNPADISLGELNNKREIVVGFQEVQRLFHAMNNYPIPKYRYAFQWLATGRRLNEVLSLHMKDIDLEKMIFQIHEDNSKSGKKLTFVLREELLESLENKFDLVHPSDKGTKMDGATIRKHWAKVLQTAGLKELHIHDLRHIIGSSLRDSGVSEDIRALVLGHSKSTITARYASQNAQLANDVFQFFMDKINGVLDPKAKWME